MKVKLGIGSAFLSVAVASALWVPLHAATDAVPPSDETKLHLESCTVWKEVGMSFGFTNKCGEPVALQYMLLNGGHKVDRVVRPDERFDTGLPEKTHQSTGWLFTACPAGYVPNAPFTVENKSQILKGQYECVRK
jgi:hypothetical protein